MEARQTLGANAVANGARILIAVFVAAVLVGAIALSVSSVRTSSGSGVYTEVHPAPGTVLRQDNPVQSQPSAPSIYVQGGRPQAVYDEIAAYGQKSIYVQGGRPQAVYDEIARHGQQQ